MKIVSVLAQKGGVGKTTLTLHWAVEAERQGLGPVAVIDTDTQQSAAAWYRRREHQTPVVLNPPQGELQDALQACQNGGIKLVFIDTMPRIEQPSIEAAQIANLSIIPCGASIVDIDAIGATVSIVEKVARPGIIVLNQGRPGSGINEKAAHVVSQYGLPVCPVHIMRRAALADAFTDGRAVVELEPSGKAAAEITESWHWIAKQLRRAK